MEHPTARPLLTFALAAYNQERFIREAVEGAFAQTYSPLEVILSDDCSRDRTFKIIQDMAAAYRGPHRIVTNRNSSQRGLGGHVNRLVELSRGELIVGAAGDDVSLPQRTQSVYEGWERSGRQATSIHSNILQVDETGQPTDQIFRTSCHGDTRDHIEQPVDPLAYTQTLEPLVFGCAHAFARRLFTVFGDLPENVVHEDNALAFRSALVGKLLYVNQVLVKYRVHSDNIFIRSQKCAADLQSLARQEDRVHKDWRHREIMYEAFLSDLETAKARGLISMASAAKVAAEAIHRRDRVRLMGKFLESGLFGKWRILRRLRREGLDERESRMLVRRLLPRGVLLRLRLARSYAALAWGQPS